MDISGKIPGSARASKVFPTPGEPTINMVCPKNRHISSGVWL
jgi:hypothetical protein